MNLYLVQHGEALSKDVDPDRPLSDRGKADVGRIAWHLAMLGLELPVVQHSGKTRARQSAEILAAALGAVCEARDGLDPNAPPEPLAEAAAGWHEDIMLVGHLPFMARLVDRLAGGRDGLGLVAFRPGSLVCLARDEEGAWQIAWMLRPELVAAGAA